MSGEAIRSARDRLFSFFVLTYHLKDGLKEESGIEANIIEGAVRADPDLALLADLANLDKHGRLDRPPRSGSVPRIGEVAGLQDGAGSDGWRLSMPIHHGDRTLDGLTVARGAVDAWRRHLKGWKLL
jgi:hypothetical protein